MESPSCDWHCCTAGGLPAAAADAAAALGARLPPKAKSHALPACRLRLWLQKRVCGGAEATGRSQGRHGGRRAASGAGGGAAEVWGESSCAGGEVECSVGQ